jgi:formamidopyrimidine-DNA glycosylase
MPELPEVETVVRELRIHLPGKHIVRASLTAPDLYRRGSANVTVLAGARIVSVDRRGKAIVIALEGKDESDRLVVHLGMTGRLEWTGSARERAATDRAHVGASEGEPNGMDGARPREQARLAHLHARWHFGDGSELRYFDPRRFGYIFVGSAASVDETLHIGPDPFQLDAPALARVLQGRHAPVKALLLDQRLVSGLGNIYVDEALHLARIHPLVAGDRAAARAPVILAAARRILARAIRARGTTLRDYRRTDGGRGGFQVKLSVYGREGETCRTCGAAIRRIEVAQRGTHFCPRCQRPPRVSRSLSKASRGGRSRRAAPRQAGYTRSR